MCEMEQKRIITNEFRDCGEKGENKHTYVTLSRKTRMKRTNQYFGTLVLVDKLFTKTVQLIYVDFVFRALFQWKHQQGKMFEALQDRDVANIFEDAALKNEFPQGILGGKLTHPQNYTLLSRISCQRRLSSVTKMCFWHIRKRSPLARTQKWNPFSLVNF